MIVRDVLAKSASWLAGKGSASARLEAELLLAHVLSTERLGLYTRDADRPLVEGELDRYRELLRRRAGGEPVAYITGRREFYGVELEITRDVLVPRPETELLVDRARELKPATVLDLGTGSGCIAIACKVKLPEAAVTATDVSAAALLVATRNAARHGAEVRFLGGDLFAAVPEGERFDLIVSNPPYVPDGEAGEVAAFEPKGALFAGPAGLDVIRRIVEEAPDWLAETGTLLVEIGEDQEEAACGIAAAAFSAEVRVHRDLASHPRLLEARGS